jgi:hypothetical protein
MKNNNATFHVCRACMFYQLKLYEYLPNSILCGYEIKLIDIQDRKTICKNYMV